MNDFVDNLYEQLREQNCMIIRIATVQLIFRGIFEALVTDQCPTKGYMINDKWLEGSH